MLKVKYEDLDNYNLSELKEIIKQLNEDNKEKDNIIKELEYRLEKFNIFRKRKQRTFKKIL